MKFLRTIGSVKVAIALLSVTAVACLVGTLMPQATGNQLVYRTGWFSALLAALSLNLFACTVSRYASWPRRIGSVITHLSILLIMAGAIVDGLLGQRGMLNLHIGESGATFRDERREMPLPFTVRLADFAVERYPARAALAVWRPETGDKPDQIIAEPGSQHRIGRTDWSLRVAEVLGSVGEVAQLVAVTAPDGKLGLRIACDDGHGHGSLIENCLIETERQDLVIAHPPLQVSLRVFPDAAARDRELTAVQPVAGNGVIEVQGADGVVQTLDATPGKEHPLANGQTLTVLRYLPHFVIDGGTVRSASENPENPAVQIRVVKTGGTPKEMWLFAHFPDFNQAKGTDENVAAKFVRSAGLDVPNHLYLYAARDGSIGYAAIAAGVDGVKRGSAAPGDRIVVGTTGIAVDLVACLPQAQLRTEVKGVAPGHGPPGARLQWLKNGVADGEPFWLLARGEPATRQESGIHAALAGIERPVKVFRSTVEIIENGKVVGTHKIEVNRPLSYRGYSFYQSSYDQEQEQWSGMEVARSPGVPLVYAGFCLFLGGLVFALYVQPMLRRESGKATASGKPGINEKRPAA